MRINRYLAFCLGISRRQADTLIATNKVKIANNLGKFNDVVKDQEVFIYKDNKWIKVEKTEEKMTILMYKPKKFLVTRNDEKKRHTIYDLLPKEFFHLKPAGRLDYLSEGLLILTNDGSQITKLTHPKFHKEKVYLVGLNKVLNPKLIKQAKQGELNIDNLKLNPIFIQRIELYSPIVKEFKFLELNTNLVWYVFTLTEGRNREIRKICDLNNTFVEKNTKKNKNNVELRNLSKTEVKRLIRVKQGKFILNKNIFKKGYQILDANKN